MTIDFYPSIVHENDLSPDAFGSEIDDICNEIHAACKGWGTNVSEIQCWWILVGKDSNHFTESLSTPRSFNICRKIVF